MEDTYIDIFNETTFNILSRSTNDPVDSFFVSYIDNQSSEDNEVNVYNSIEDNKCVIQPTMDSTPSEPKKKEADKLFALEKKEETKEIKNEVVLTDDLEKMMNIENKQIQNRTKKRERNSAVKYSKGRKKAGYFLIDDLIPFHSSNRKDNKKSKIMIMFVNFTVGFLNGYIKAQRIK